MSPSDIILLSFTNSSVNDLNDVINNKFKLGVDVLTFHKLVMKFLRNTYNRNSEIIGDGGIYKVLEDYFLKVVFKNKGLLHEYLEAFDNYLYLNKKCNSISISYNNYGDIINSYESAKLLSHSSLFHYLFNVGKYNEAKDMALAALKYLMTTKKP